MNDIQRAIEILERNKPTSDPRLCGKELCNACDVAISAMQELQQYRQIGTLGQCDGYKNHSQHISKLHSCNDCGRRRDCKIAPQLGDYCRINCYFWETKTVERPKVERIIIDDVSGKRAVEIVKAGETG